MEMGKEETAGKGYVVVMELDPLSRLKTQFRSMRRRVYFFQSISLLFCFSICLFTIINHAYPSTCKENVTEAPKFEMQRQGRKALTLTQINTSITRLTVKHGAFPKNVSFTEEEQPVPWMLSRVNLAPNHIQSLTLEGNGTLLRVHRDGMYKVSLQITYRGTEEWCGWMENKASYNKENKSSYTLQHNIKQHTDSYSNGALPLLTYMETVTFTSSFWSKSIFSEGIFFLHSGDRLEVRTNSLPLIDFRQNVEQKSVFVVYPHFST